MDVLKIYGVDGKLLEGMRSFYQNDSAPEFVNQVLCESFNIGVSVRQECIMSPRLLNIYMSRWMKQKLKVRGRE